MVSRLVRADRTSAQGSEGTAMIKRGGVRVVEERVKLACRVLFEFPVREVIEGVAEIDDKRATVIVWVERPPEGQRSHTITFALADRGILWADASNEEEARAFRAGVALR